MNPARSGQRFRKPKKLQPGPLLLSANPKGQTWLHVNTH